MTRLDGPVGLRNGVQPVASHRGDQRKLIDLLWRTEPANGGQKGLEDAPEPGADRACEPRLAAAIMAFQAFWVARGEFRAADGVIDPGGRSLAKLDRVAGAPPPAPPAPSREFNGMQFRQTASSALTGAHEVTNPVVAPDSVTPFLFAPRAANARLRETSASGRMHEFLFEIRKDGAVFWVGAAVPAGTRDFTKAYVYFHPTVINGGAVHAADGDYRNFRGGWSGSIQRYVAMQGGQMAAVRQITVLVPFMTMASMNGSAATNMFATRGVDTLNAIMAAVQAEFIPDATTQPTLAGIGAASFSSGVGHLSRFLGFVGSSGLVRETMDFDSAFIISEHATVPAIGGGAAQWQITQVATRTPRIGWVALPGPAWANVRTFDSIHAKIGWMMFHPMMMFSALR